MTSWTISAAALLCSVTAMAETFESSAAARPQTPVACRRAVTPIAADGSGDWSRAETIDHFAAHWDAAAAAAPARSSARLLWDDDYLYFAADLTDDELISSSSRDGDRLWLGDVFELFFKPREDAAGYYEFQVNPAGARLNMFLPERRADAYDLWHASRQFDWTVSARRTDTGWTVSGRIPWSDFAPSGGAPRPGDTWRFALCRYDYSSHGPPVLSSTAPLRQPSFHRHEEWQQLRFAE